MKKLIISCLLSSCWLSSVAQQAPLAWVEAQAHPLSSAAEAPDADLGFLDAALRGTSLCGLGEASHGTHEFYLTKLRLVRYLVRHLHYRHLGFEYEAGAIEPLNTYIQTGQGDARALLRPLHLYATEEIYQLVQWLAAYNQTQASAAKVTLFGFDTNYTPAYQAAAAATCLQYVQQHPRLLAAAAAEPVLAKIKAGPADVLFKLTDPEATALRQLATAVRTSPGHNDQVFQRFAQQLALLDEGTRLGDPLARDPFMADNIVAYQRAHPGPTMVWGHNVHLAKDTTMTNYRGMGYYLRRYYGPGYYALGFDTYQGQVNVLAKGQLVAESFTAQPSSFSALLAQAKHPAFFLPLPAGAAQPLGATNQLITNINANWTAQRELPIRLGVDFDGLIFLRQTTASVPLK